MTQTEGRSGAPVGGNLVTDIEALAHQAGELADRAADLARVAQGLADRAEAEPGIGAVEDEAERADIQGRVARALSEVGDSLAKAHDAERAAGVSAEWLSVRILPEGVPTRVGWRGGD